MSPTMKRAWVLLTRLSRSSAMPLPMHPLLLSAMEGVTHFHTCCFVSTSLNCTVPATEV